ncbi:MAG: tRNA (adenosine(37)-N6)-dimethylallyltransferase MiaA [Novosphingobium sp.]
MSTEKSLDGTGEKASDGASALPPVALIAGPTASGKSDCAVRLALALAERARPAMVINADSAQLYADLRVISARPSPEEMRGVQHLLFGTWDGAQPCSATDWAAAARAEITRAHGQGAVPILVGGTGLYIRTLLDGIAPVQPIDPDVRAAVRALPVAEAHAALLREDPERAATLAPADSARIARALEVVRATGRPLAAWQAERSGGIGGQIALHPLVLLPERDWLYTRCDARFTQMLGHGAIAEVEALLARALDPALPVMRAIGVAEIAGYLRGAWPLDQAQARGAQATRNYAKRQLTWLRHQTPAGWPRINPEGSNPLAAFATLLRN